MTVSSSTMKVSSVIHRLSVSTSFRMHLGVTIGGGGRSDSMSNWYAIWVHVLFCSFYSILIHSIAGTRLTHNLCLLGDILFYRDRKGQASCRPAPLSPRKDE